MSKRRLYQVNLIPKRRSIYALVGLLLASILFATCATVFIGVYSYISTYLGESDDTLILTQSGSGNFIATRYISMQIAESAEYVQGVTLVSPETLTPCMIREKTCFVRGIECNKFYLVENLVLEAGRLLTNEDIHGAFIGNRAAQRLQISVGDSFLIYSGLRDISLQVTAIGIYSSEDTALNDEVLIPLSIGQILSGNYPDKVTYIRVEYNDSVISRSSLEDSLISQHLLTVQILSNETGEHVQNVQVEIYDIQGTLIKSSISDSVGEGSFGLDFGNYTVVARSGSSQVNRSVFLESDQTISLKITSPPDLYPLNVKVWDINQIGIPYTTVIAWKGSEIIQMRQTNSIGEANFSLPSEIFQFSTLIWNNFTQEPVEFKQTANPIQNESLIFWYRHFKLGIRTNDPYSGVLLNSTVILSLINGTVLNSGTTGDLGYIEFDDLTPTSYNVSVDYSTISQNRIIDLRSDRTVNFEILPQFDLEIHVFNDSTKLPINNSNVKIHDEANNLYENFTDENGIADFLLQLNTYNITVNSEGFIKNRIINLNSSRNETFWMPTYNLTIIIENISGILQQNINVRLISASLNDSKLSENGSVTFFIPPDSYTIILNCSNVFLNQNYEITGSIDPINFIIPPYNLTVSVFNGTDSGTPPLSGVNVTIYDNSSKEYLTSTMTIAGISNFLMNPGVYNVSVNLSNTYYHDVIEVVQSNVNVSFYSYPFNLSVIIFNGTTSAPQENIQIQLFDLQNNLIAGPQVTDSGGYATFMVAPRIYNITLNNTDYVLSKIRNLVAPNTLLTFEFPPYNLTITVFNASDNAPIQNAQVDILQYQDNSTLFSKFTTVEGIAQFALDPGNYYINLSYQNYNLLQFKEIIADPLISYHIPPYKLDIQVIDYWGSPIVDANVSVNGGDPYLTNGSGFVTLFLDPDIYSITATYDNFTEVKLVDMTDYQEIFRVSLLLTQKYSLNVSIVNAISGRYLENASISVLDLSGDLIDKKHSDSNGFSQFTLNPQLYNISVEFDQTHESQLFNLSTDEAIIFSIIPFYRLTIFTFDDSTTHYSKDVNVQILDLGGQLLFQDITNDNGECTFDLEYGTYNISINKGLEQKSEILDISQPEFLAFHMAPYKIIVTTINSTTLGLVPNVLITIKTLNGTEIASDSTNALGVAEFLVDADQYYIYAEHSGKSWKKQVDLRQKNTSLHLIFSISTAISSNIDVGDPIEYSASLLEQTLGLTESIVYVLAIILTILVSFSIMNVVSASISESRQLIGIIRSIGASNRQVYYLINLRIILISAVSGTLGGFIGIFLGSFISIGALEISLTQIVTLELFSSLLLLALGITVLIGLISANLTLFRILKRPIAITIKEILPQAV